MRTVVLLSVRATQSPSGPAATEPGWSGTRSVAVTPRVVMAEPDPCVASQTEPTIAATTDTTTTTSRYRGRVDSGSGTQIIIYPTARGFQ